MIARSSSITIIKWFRILDVLFCSIWSCTPDCFKTICFLWILMTNENLSYWLYTKLDSYINQALITASFALIQTEYSAAMPWSTRMKIALGAAKGLAFLHEADKPVIYRDFKASNILLDSVCSVISCCIS